MIDSISQEVRNAFRQLRKNAGLTFAAIFALALGIGANTTIFSTVNALLLNSQPFRSIREPRRVMSVYERNPAVLAFISERLPVRFKNYLEWKKQNHSFEDLAAYQDTHFDLSSTGGGGNREPESVQAARATANFFPLLGVRPVRGRNFTVQEMQKGRDRVTIISDDLWRSRFQGDPQIVGKNIRVTGAEYEIIGVLPDAFELPALWQGLNQSKPKMWVPLPAEMAPQDEGNTTLAVLGRLKPSATVTGAKAEMKVIGERLQRAYPDKNRGWGVNVFPTLDEDLDPSLRRSLYILQVAVGFVLLIACANVANLLLTKAVAREQEMAVRVALGASRWQIVRQTMSEGLLLSLFGGALGLLLAFGALRLISVLAPRDTHGFHELRIDPLVLAFTFASVVVSAVLFGLAPSLYSMTRGVSKALTRQSRSVAGSANFFRTFLVVAEISLSLILLIGASLTIRSLQSLMSLDLGFDPQHLLTMSIALPESRYGNPQHLANFNDRLLERVQQLADVRAASLSTALPMRSISEQGYELPGVPADPNKPRVTDWTRMTEQHVRAVGMRVLRGRDLQRADVVDAQPHTALVNEAFARENWPNQDALGKTFLFASETSTKKVPYTVVGMVSNERQFGPESTPHTQIYLPGHHMRSMSLVVRTAGDPLAQANAVKQQVWAIDKDQPVSEVDSMNGILREWTAPRRFVMTVLINFAVVALILAVVGLYSVLAYSVTLRTREIGVRVALGAEPGNVVRLVLARGLKLTTGGIVVGIVGAFALTRYMQNVIFGISAADPVTFLGVSALLTVTALAASYLPARRASRIDPMTALRTE